MVFCNKEREHLNNIRKGCHNPYFNRWFSAIVERRSKSDAIIGHNPYFNRWFSAI